MIKLSNILNYIRVNILHIFSPKITDDEILLIKNTSLFKNINNQTIVEMKKSLKLVNYKKSQLIFREGEHGDYLYIIKEGSVRVFTHDQHGVKIALARLNRGDYFGEQALLGELHKIRNANVESIEATTLIKIDSKFLTDQIQRDHSLKAQLSQIGSQQAINNLILSAKFYNDIIGIHSEAKEHNIIDYPEGKLIFSFGDKPNNAYIILQGEVELLIPIGQPKNLKSIVLHKGSIFGELGIIRNKPRIASAITHKKSRLLVISSDELKSDLLQFPGLQKLFNSLQNIYELPSHTFVEQYIGNLAGLGPTITSIFKIEDGRSIISSKTVNEDFFNIITAGIISEKIYRYAKESLQIELFVSNHYLIGAKVLGVWDDLPSACEFILQKKEISTKLLENFEYSSNLLTAAEKQQSANSEIVCQCMSVTRGTLQDLIDRGVRDFAELSSTTGACTVCKCCKFRILEMIGESSWIPTVMLRGYKHNEYIQSFKLKLTTKDFKSIRSGQYVIIQVKIGNLWLERPYTISDVLENNEIRVTIKKEPKGYFTTWLFETAPDQFEIKVSSPQGEFILNPDITEPAFCFAGGIGITPFIAYAKKIAETSSNKKLHIIYCARTEKDFILIDEFNEIIKRTPSISIDYRPTDKVGVITEDEIAKIINNNDQPDIYICGPEGFEKSIHNTLQKLNYDPHKIHSEQFVHAGSR